jgi:glycosyltransferase involved in cell wall biosynthesis
MHILQLTSRMPWPLTDGGTIGICNITRSLAELGHSITLVTYPLDDSTATKEATIALSKFAEIEMVSKPLPARWKVLIRTVFRGAYPIERRMMPEMFQLLKHILEREKFDIVHVDQSHMGNYGLWLKRTYGIPIVLREHNYEALIYERFAQTETNPIKRFLARIHGKRLKREEIRFLTNFDAVAAISSEDVAAMKQVAPKGNYSVIPAGVDTNYFHPTNTEVDPHSIISLGTLASEQNYDATRFFLDAIFPLILAKLPSAMLHIIGASEQRILPITKRFGSSVKVYGVVPDVRDYLAYSAVLVVPLRVGGGMRLKLLEAFAAGKAIVSTSIGAEGNVAQNGTHILIRDGASDFAEGVVELLSNSKLRQTLGLNARELAVSKYGWDHIVSEFVNLYNHVLCERQNREKFLNS